MKRTSQHCRHFCQFAHRNAPFRKFFATDLPLVNPLKYLAVGEVVPLAACCEAIRGCVAALVVVASKSSRERLQLEIPKAYLDGVDRLLTKPVIATELIGAVCELLREEQTASSGVR